MDDIEQKIKETQRELAELKQRKRDAAGQRINDCIAEYGDRLAECNDMLNTLLETSKKLGKDIERIDVGWTDKVPPELRNELMRKRRAFSSLVQEVKTQTLFATEPNEWARANTAHFIGSMLVDGINALKK